MQDEDGERSTGILGSPGPSRTFDPQVNRVRSLCGLSAGARGLQRQRRLLIATPIYRYEMLLVRERKCYHRAQCPLNKSSPCS
jgi:hypothetical protein